MLLGLVMTFGFLFLVWLIFFRLKWIKFSIMWGFLCSFFFLHLLIIFLIGLRFVTPYSTNARVIQHTIQLVPRLPEPTLVTKVWVENNLPVKKGDKLIEFDRRPYEYKVNSIKAQLAAAKQNVKQLKVQWEVQSSMVMQAKAQQAGLQAGYDATAASLKYAQAKRELAFQAFTIANQLHEKDPNAIAKLRFQQSQDTLNEADAGVRLAQANEVQARISYQQTAEANIQTALANEKKARLACESEIDGVNTSVAQLEAELKMAEYYLENTVLVAPEDGYILNLQVQPGMVAGTVRFGAIASFIVDTNRYVLATFTQENLKFVKEGQPVELALDLYPGQIFQAKVKSIWKGSGEGQMLPSGDLPRFNPLPPETPQGQFAVQIVFIDPDQSRFPIGTQGTAAIYTADGSWAVLRRIEIRGRTWLNWLYPLNF